MFFTPFGDRRNNGVDHALIDAVLNGKSDITFCKVIKPIFKKQHIAFIGLSVPVMPKEIIQVGNLGLKYQVIGHIKQVLPRGGYVLRIKRVDGANITQLDIDATNVGDKAKIVSRRSTRQRMDQLIESLKDTQTDE